MKKILAFAQVMMLGGSAEALENFYGHQMIKLCFGRNGPGPLSATYCNGYIAGVLNPASFMLNNLIAEPTFCIPKETTNNRVQDIIKKYVDNNPHLLHQPVTFLIIEAMEKEFPCADKKS